VLWDRPPLLSGCALAALSQVKCRLRWTALRGGGFPTAAGAFLGRIGRVSYGGFHAGLGALMVAAHGRGFGGFRVGFDGFGIDH